MHFTDIVGCVVIVSNSKCKNMLSANVFQWRYGPQLLTAKYRVPQFESSWIFLKDKSNMINFFLDSYVYGVLLDLGIP